MITVKEIAWLAGLLEGEGCFDYANNSPRIKVKMTDKDIVDRIASLFNRNSTTRHNTKLHNKMISETSCRGKKAIGWMMTIYSLMGRRRKEKILSIINRYKVSKSRHLWH